jgi:hypothetical protein
MDLNTKAVEMALMLLHIGGLSGSAALISIGHLIEAFLCAIVASACVLILTGATALAQLVRLKVNEMDRRHSIVPSSK